MELLNTAKTSFIVKNNRLLLPYSNLQRIIVQLKCQDMIILVAFSLSEEAQTASFEAFISIGRAAESMFLLVQKKWSSFLQWLGSLTSGTSCQFLLKWWFTRQEPATEKLSWVQTLQKYPISTAWCVTGHSLKKRSWCLNPKTAREGYNINYMLKRMPFINPPEHSSASMSYQLVQLCAKTNSKGRNIWKTKMNSCWLVSFLS